MTRYFFHLRDHTDQLLDPEGFDCPDASAVADQALKSARDLIAGDAITGEIDMRYRIDVEDTSENIVHSLEFEDAVAIKRAAQRPAHAA